DPGQLHPIDSSRHALMLADRSGGSDRHLDGKMRSATDCRGHDNLVIENARNAFDDREPKPQSARHLGSLIEPVEFLENRALLGSRNAQTGVIDVNAQPAAAPPAADEHTSLWSILDRIGDEVLE